MGLQDPAEPQQDGHFVDISPINTPTFSQNIPLPPPKIHRLKKCVLNFAQKSVLITELAIDNFMWKNLALQTHTYYEIFTTEYNIALPYLKTTVKVIGAGYADVFDGKCDLRTHFLITNEPICIAKFVENTEKCMEIEKWKLLDGNETFEVELIMGQKGITTWGKAGGSPLIPKYNVYDGSILC